MAQGLQVFDADGNLTVDITDRLTKYIGSFTIDPAQSSGTVVNSEIGDGDLWYCFRLQPPDTSTIGDTESVSLTYPTIKKSTGKLKWSYPSSASSETKRFGVTVYYGVW